MFTKRTPLFFLLLVLGLASADDVPSGRFEIERTVGSFGGQENAGDSITWQVYVPESYDPASPAGLVVWVSPTSEGRLPAKWQAAFDAKNLIWIGADDSGNRVLTKKRMMMATLAPYAIQGLYQVDTERVYVAGFSGGGKVASFAAVNFSRLFSGAIYICGVESLSNFDSAVLDSAKSGRYVFVTGRNDFNRTLTRRVHKEYVRAGLENSDLVIIPNMGHELPNRNRFLEALNYLDGSDRLETAHEQD